MATEPSPEIGGDASGPVPPPAGGRGSEWPKKIRTLTAAELDRLTIDSSGRFYWDGKLVNYEPPKPREPEPLTADTADRSAMEILDRAASELSEPSRKGADTVKEPEPQVPGGMDVAREELRAVDSEPAQEAPPVSLAAPIVETSVVSPQFYAPDRVRLSLSLWQSLGAIVVVLGILVGATGVAAFGWIAVHDWGCRVGMIKSYCPPPPPVAKPPSRPDIPA